MGHIHSVYDTDKHFTIDPATRALVNQNPNKNSIMQFDHNSERITFDLPRMVDGHDMMSCNRVEVHYLNIDAQTKESKPGLYEVDDLAISPADDALTPEEENTVGCSWLVSRNATQLVGPLWFRVTFHCVTEADSPDYSWSTAVYKGLSVADGINNSDWVAEDYVDILEQWYNRIVESCVYSVVVTADIENEVASHSVTEIKEFLDKGWLVTMDSNGQRYSLGSVSPNTVVFYRIDVGPDTIQYRTHTVTGGTHLVSKATRYDKRAEVDTSLTEEGMAADAKATGNAFAAMNQAIQELSDHVDELHEEDSGIGALIVTIDEGAGLASHSASEIMSAVSAILLRNGELYHLAHVSENVAVFKGYSVSIDDLGSNSWFVYNDKTTKYVHEDGGAYIQKLIDESDSSVELDTTLSKSGMAADAKAVGDSIAQGMDVIEQVSQSIPRVDSTLSKAGQAADAGAVGAVLEEAMGVLGSLNTLPDMTEADNGKIPQVVDGQIVYTDPASMTVGEVTLETYIGNAVNSYIEEALGGEY